jgi:hypothetical protein
LMPRKPFFGKKPSCQAGQAVQNERRRYQQPDSTHTKTIPVTTAWTAKQ